MKTVKEIALEVAKESAGHNSLAIAEIVSHSMAVDFALRFLAAVDAERAKQGAVAWIDNSGFPKHSSCLQSASENRLYGPMRPLYLSPRVPDEMVLVPKKSCEEIIDCLIDTASMKGGWDWERVATDFRAITVAPTPEGI